MEVDDPVMKKLAHTVLHGDGSKEDESIDKEQQIISKESTENPPPYIEQHLIDGFERRLKERQSKRKGALVFCVACGAVKRTLRKWHNSYLCEDCYKIAKNVGDEKFIAALKGED